MGTDNTTAINQLISDLAQQGFTGKVEINFFKGGIGSVKKEETIRLGELSPA